MRLWIDNTGLHGAGKCLTSAAQTPYDFKGLLQLGTLIVFAETMEFGDFEPEEIAETSRQFLEEMRPLGVDESIILVRTKSRDEYARACRAAADFGAEELICQFSADETLVSIDPTATIPRGAQFRAERTEWIATQLEDDSELARINETALDARAMGAIDYMLSGSAPLRRVVSAIIDREQAWSHGHTFQVESMLRAYLNEQLAQQIHASYAPAAHRADVVARQNDWVVNQLSNALDPIVEKLRGAPLGVPSVYEALIRKSRGDPRGVVGAAIEMRATAADLRSALRALQKTGSDNPASEFKIRREIADLARGVRMDLGLESPWDAVVLEVPLGMPTDATISSPIKALLDWARLRWHKGRRIVLTDIVKTAALSGTGDAVYRKLIARSFGRDLALAIEPRAQLEHDSASSS
jgi:hypothetical protein